jgi:aryl-alcohol dehydrogenase-like predicted oxidoreductase
MTGRKSRLAWPLRRSPAIIIPIPRTRAPAELEDNVAACVLRLEAAQIAQIEAPA